MSKKNPFKRSKDHEIKLHAEPRLDKKIVKRSFSLYEEDYEAIAEMIEPLSQYTNKRMTKSLVVRAAINYLRVTLESGKPRSINRVKETVRESV